MSCEANRADALQAEARSSERKNTRGGAFALLCGTFLLLLVGLLAGSAKKGFFVNQSVRGKIWI